MPLDTRRFFLAALGFVTWAGSATPAHASEPKAADVAETPQRAPQQHSRPVEREPYVAPEDLDAVTVQDEAGSELEPESRWYGWQTLLVDAGSIALLIASASEGPGDGEIGIAGYVVGGPIVHFAHSNTGTGFLSLGLRVGAPLAGVAIGVGAEDCNGGGEFCGLAGAVIGGLVGVATAIVIDAAVLAYDEPERKQRPAAAFALTPRLVLGRERAEVGLQGTF